MKRTAVLLAAIAVVLAAAGCGAAKEISVGFIATNFSAEAQARVANSFEKLAKEKGWDVKMLNSARTCTR